MYLSGYTTADRLIADCVFYELMIRDTPRVVILQFDDHHAIFIWHLMTVIGDRHLMTVIVLWRFHDISSSSFDDFMTVKPWRRARKFKPYFTYMDMKNMRLDIYPIVLHHSGYGNSNTLYMDYSPISIGQRI